MGVEVPNPPRSTYRLQMHAGFGFDATAAIADYLERVGRQPCLLVSLLAGRQKKHARLRCASIRRAKRRSLAAKRPTSVLPGPGPASSWPGARRGSQPHEHRGSPTTRWWWDVLENGPSSRYAAYFDVEWHPPEAKLHNLVLLPDSGRPLRPRDRSAAKSSCYARAGDSRCTISSMPRRWPRDRSTICWPPRPSGAESATLAFMADAFGRLPISTATDRTSIARRHRDKEVLQSIVGTDVQCAARCRGSHRPGC